MTREMKKLEAYIIKKGFNKAKVPKNLKAVARYTKGKSVSINFYKDQAFMHIKIGNTFMSVNLQYDALFISIQDSI